MTRKRDSRVARESEFRAAYHALWVAAKVANVPAVLAALQRFQNAAVALHLSQQVRPVHAHDRWPRD
jgi:hypothetical protein